MPLARQPYEKAMPIGKASQVTDPQALLHIVASLSMMSLDLISAFEDGEAYETLKRKAKGLHHNLEEISLQAKSIAANHIPE
jgi:hypothetical protein